MTYPKEQEPGEIMNEIKQTYFYFANTVDREKILLLKAICGSGDETEGPESYDRSITLLELTHDEFTSLGEAFKMFYKTNGADYSKQKIGPGGLL